MELVIQAFGPTIGSWILGVFLLLWVGTAVAAGIASISGPFLPLLTYAVIQDIIKLRVRLKRPRASFERMSLFYKLQSIPSEKLAETRPMKAHELLQLQQQIPGGLDAVADTVGRRFAHAFGQCEPDEQSEFLAGARRFLMDESWKGGDAASPAAVREPPPSAPDEVKAAKKVSKKKTQAKGTGKKTA